MYSLEVVFKTRKIFRFNHLDKEPEDSIVYILLDILEDYITDLNKEPIEDNETKRVFLNNTLTFVKEIRIERCDNTYVDYALKPKDNDYTNVTIEGLASSIRNAVNVDKVKVINLIDHVVPVLLSREESRYNHS